MELRINETGVRTGEFITSSSSGKQSKGAVLQVRGVYPADISLVNKLTPIQLQDSLNVIPFFNPMSAAQRLEWLINNGTTTKKLYIEDAPNVFVKFLKIGTTNFFTKILSQDTRDTLLQGNPQDPEGYWPIKEVYDLFPRKPGSRTRKVTMIFRPSNWVLMIPERLVQSYNGIYIFLNEYRLNHGIINAPTGGRIYSFDTESKIQPLLPKIGIVITENRPNPLTETSLFNLASNHVNINIMNNIKPFISWFPPSLHKSLIQKLIRTRCDNVEYNGQLYPAAAVLLTSLSLLILNPGVFVPNIRRFVTGIESAAKRLGVSIHEDSYTERNNVMMGLYASAMVAQDDRNWLPTDTMINDWFTVAIEAQGDYRAYSYDFRTFNGQIKQYTDLSMAYFLLSEIRSFQSDIDIVGSISQNQGRPKLTNPDNIKINTMSLIHCLDHHSFAEIVHYMPYTGVGYPKLLDEIWDQVVGVNPRYPKFKTYATIMEREPFVKLVRIAQRDLWTSKTFKPQLRSVYENLNTPFTYKLDSSWLAGLVGPIEVKLPEGVTAIVVLRVDDIQEMTAVKRPQRDAKDNPELTDAEQIKGILMAKTLLSNGIKLTNVPTTLPLLTNSIVYLRNNEYLIVLKNGQCYKWETIINLTYSLPIHPSIEPTINNALILTGDGIDQKSNNAINYIVTTYNTESLRRLSTYLTGYKSTIELTKISRYGTGTYYQVVPEDTAVNQILCYICVMYPAAIMKTKMGFKVKNGPLLWSIRDLINSELGKTVTFGPGWITPKVETRNRWEHQIDSVRQMVQRNQDGKKGHLIWIKVGLGKTLISIDYLDYLIKNNRMPPYCVYSLPASAINNIVKEMQLRGIPTKVLDARLNSTQNQKTIEPYKVCLIKHDHMRRNGMDTQLKSIARQMVFIVDEFHKTLSKTIRTSLALELSRLSYDFIGMSGTIIKDTNYDELIKWLEQIVEFEVTEKNYWVAIGALVSRKVHTRVVVDRNAVSVPLGNMSEAYYKLVPEKIGGTARQIDFRGAVDICYQVVTVHIVNTIKQYNDMGEGVFVVTKDVKHQKSIRDQLINIGFKPNQIGLFTKDNQITLTSEYNGPIKVVITTKRHSEGYTLTKFRIMITSVYFSNQATREQLEGRINRIGQISPNVRVIIYHTGILSYIHEKYEKARTLSQALKGFAGEVGIDYQTLKGL